ncbi:MAG: FAD-binding oxidoreductase [Rhodobacteraceae bacterium]|nr:FAD-binding oxidoreductase [Paracoccaceae bacterium]MCY4196677.1 FAD-binding oxidoreductase [Paracoccaceae bacterium]MCY4326252.1 FAD-binding oxidoreductase [Paracoccaceae bacterium]
MATDADEGASNDMQLNPAGAELLDNIKSAAPGSVILDSEERYRTDPRQRRNGQEGLVVAPKSVAQVAAIASLCNQHRVALVPFGGGTGLVGGQLAYDLPRPCILSLERLNRIREVNPSATLVTVEAGCTLQQVQAVATDKARVFPLSLASKGSCQIGGNLATNAGGSNVIRYGNMRHLCLGIEAVFADGGVWNGLSGLCKDNRGFDLRDLLIGSEGTLAIMTAACLKLVSVPSDRVVFLASLAHPEAGLRLLEKARLRFDSILSAFELISRVGIDFLMETDADFHAPFDPLPDWMVLVDIGSECDMELSERVTDMLEEAVSESVIGDAIFASSGAQIESLWSLRDSIPAANRRIGAVASHDISLPLDALVDFMTDCEAALAAIGEFRVNCFGHLGDGNLHYNVFPPRGVNAVELAGLQEQVRHCVYETVRSFGGSTSAEHGTGRVLAEELQQFSDSAYMGAMAAIKAALDPHGILNPGAVLTHPFGS